MSTTKKDIFKEQKRSKSAPAIVYAPGKWIKVRSYTKQHEVEMIIMLDRIISVSRRPTWETSCTIEYLDFRGRPDSIVVWATMDDIIGVMEGIL